MQVPYSRGHELVTDNSSDEILAPCSCVSEATVIKLGSSLDPLNIKRSAIEDAPAKPQDMSKNAKRRARQRAKAPQQFYEKKRDTKYIPCLRLALCSYVKMTDDYYGSRMGI